MDERKEILQDTIDRLIETALQELDQKLPEAGGEAALSHISDQIRQDAQLDEQHRKLMLDYRHGHRLFYPAAPVADGIHRRSVPPSDQPAQKPQG